MPSTAYNAVTRRAALAGLGLLLPGSALAQAKPRIVTMLGDSITAGLGLPAKQALPFQLETELKRLGKTVRVRGAGVSGDTSAGGVSRVDFSVQADTALCLVALGGNDLLQGIPPARTQANLDRILARLKARKIRAMLVGLRAPPALGRSYSRDFSAIFPALAKKYGVPLYGDLLTGVAGVPALNQRDAIHPNAAGVRKIAAGLAPAVARALG